MMPEAPVEILLVEDNPRDADLTIRALRQHQLANHLIHLEDGAEALDFLWGRGAYVRRSDLATPRVVLLDLKLPKINGLEVLAQLRADERTRTLPVVVVTSSAEDPDVRAAYELGANSYVVKPVGFEGFAAAMRQVGYYWLLVNRPAKSPAEPARS